MKKEGARLFTNICLAAFLILLFALLWFAFGERSPASLQLLIASLFLLAGLSIVAFRQSHSAVFREAVRSHLKFIWRYHSGKAVAVALFVFAFLFNNLGLIGRISGAALSRARAEYVSVVPDVKAYELANKGKSEWSWLREFGEDALNKFAEASVKAQQEVLAGFFGALGSATNPEQKQAMDVYRKLSQDLSKEQPKTTHNPWALTEEARKLQQSGGQTQYPAAPPVYETPPARPMPTPFGQKDKIEFGPPKINAQPTPGRTFNDPTLRRP